MELGTSTCHKAVAMLFGYEGNSRSQDQTNIAKPVARS